MAGLAAGLCIAGAGGGARAAGSDASPPDAVRLWARQTWIEGPPIAQATALGDREGAALAALLGDPDEAAAHANAVVALGLCACGPAFEALRDFDALPRAGELDAGALRAFEQVPYAMGHLARAGDARALAWLEREAARARGPLAFRHAHRSGARLARERRLAALQGLGLAATPAADAVLARLEARERDPAVARRIARARAVCARIGAHGLEALAHGAPR